MIELHCFFVLTGAGSQRQVQDKTFFLGLLRFLFKINFLLLLSFKD